MAINTLANAWVSLSHQVIRCHVHDFKILLAFVIHDNDFHLHVQNQLDVAKKSNIYIGFPKDNFQCKELSSYLFCYQ